MTGVYDDPNRVAHAKVAVMGLLAKRAALQRLVAEPVRLASPAGQPAPEDLGAR